MEKLRKFRQNLSACLVFALLIGAGVFLEQRPGISLELNRPELYQSRTREALGWGGFVAVVTFLAIYRRSPN